MNTNYLKPLRFRTNCGFEFFDLEEIIRFEGRRNKALLFSTNNEKPSVISMNLKMLYCIIKEKGFCRCHRSHIVNIRHINAYYCLTRQIKLDDDTIIPVSNNCNIELKDFCNTFIH